jgi:RNA polymerase sigma factor (TIGR02999 family)
MPSLTASTAVVDLLTRKIARRRIKAGTAARNSLALVEICGETPYAGRLGLMEAPPKRDVTELLSRWTNGDREALDALVPVVYGELRRMAARYLRRERAGHTLQPTALVHEAFLKLIDQRDVHWQSRAHFFGVSAQLMRRILVDHARERAAGKRGGGCQHVALDNAFAISASNQIDIIAVDDALHRLASVDPDQVRLVELRFFAGLTIDETAEVLGWSSASVKREWTVAKAWLQRELSEGAGT